MSDVKFRYLKTLNAFMFRKSSLGFSSFLLSQIFIFNFASLQSQELPERSLRSKFRIQIINAENENIDSLKHSLAFISDEFRISAYLHNKKGNQKIQIGDFTSRDNARSKLNRISKSYPKAKVVRADQESVVYFQIYERKRPIKPEQKENAETEKRQLDPLDQNKNIPELKFESPFEAWNDKKYSQAFTAANEDYLTEGEKMVFYFLNLARMNPHLFAKTYLVANIGDPNDEYEVSLFDDLNNMQPLPCLKPNQLCWESAKCHALSAGIRGYIGHDRENCSSYFWGECCQYGPADPLEIVLQLLIDRGVSSLGHRRICLGPYTELGVSIQPHGVYGSNAVLDFR
jgi:hypothetical protein